MALPVLNLTKPGKFWATAENEETTTFHIVLPKDAYTRAALCQNPTVNPADQLMNPWVVSQADLDSDGRAILDMQKSGRAGEITSKLDEMFRKGEARPATVRAVVIVSAGKGNRVPAKQLADICDFTLGPVPFIDLTGETLIVTPLNWKAGKKDFLVDMKTEGLTEVKLSTSQGWPVRVDGGPSGAGIKAVVEGGKTYRLRIEAKFDVKKETRQVEVPPAYTTFRPGGWRTGSAPAHYDAERGGWVVDDNSRGAVASERVQHRTDTKENWQGAECTLTAEGTGSFSGLKKTIQLTAQAWASDWLKGPPPPPFSHNVC